MGTCVPTRITVVTSNDLHLHQKYKYMYKLQYVGQWNDMLRLKATQGFNHMTLHMHVHSLHIVVHVLVAQE